MSRNTLRALEEVVEALLLALPVADETTTRGSLRALDRLDQWEHLGFILELPTSANSDLYPDADEAWSEDEMTVRVRYQLRGGQREARRALHDIESRVIEAVTGSALLAELAPRWVRTDREVLPARDWYEVRIGLRFRRDQTLGYAGRVA